MSKEIDWSKAPEGAKGHGYVGLSDLPIWVGEDWYEHARDDGGRYFFSTGEDGVCAWQRGQVKNYVDRPSQAWTGQGLPPVGTVCEVLWNESRMEYLRTKVFGVNEHGQPIHRFDEGPKKFEYQADPLFTMTGVQVFRPIRTQAQIEAEEREKAIQQMVEDADYDGPTARGIYAKLYDEGYRK